MTLTPDAIRATLARGVQTEFVTPGPAKHFFGYYDKSPFDACDEKLLCHRFEGNDDRLVTDSDRCELGFYDLRTKDFTSLGSTDAFNWQQGAMLQWVGPDFKQQVVWNDIQDGAYVSRWKRLDNEHVRTLPQTVYAVSPDGHWAVSPSFERHEFCRPGYQYLGVCNQSWRHPSPDTDGIFFLDIVTGEKKLLVSMQRLLDIAPLPGMSGANHYVEHMMINPSGNRFTFHHRWQLPDGGLFTRMYCCDRTGEKLYRMPDSGFYAHQTWVNDDDIVVTGRPDSPGARLRYSTGTLSCLIRPLLRLVRRIPMHLSNPVTRKLIPFGYLQFTADGQPRGNIDNGLLGDGHPSFHPRHADWMLTDTYPDEDGYCQLFLFHIRDRRRVDIGRFWNPPNYPTQGYRCDLHPRWDRSGNRVVIDSLCSGTRQIYVLNISALLTTLRPVDASCSHDDSESVAARLLPEPS